MVNGLLEAVVSLLRQEMGHDISFLIFHMEQRKENVHYQLVGGAMFIKTIINGEVPHFSFLIKGEELAFVTDIGGEHTTSLFGCNNK